MTDKKFVSFYSGSYVCPFCDFSIPLSDENYSKYLVGNNHVRKFQQQITSSGNAGYQSARTPVIPDEEFIIELKRCTNSECKKTTISVEGRGADTKGLQLIINPLGPARSFPDYIPKSILQDYREACAIVDLSPKASGTLSRRCLQSIIRDYWDIKNKNTLFDEIQAVKPKVSSEVWEAMDHLRKLGNIGAHSEKNINVIVDITSEEAKILIKFIEYLIEISYIERYKTQQIFHSIGEISQQKQSEKKATLD